MHKDQTYLTSDVTDRRVDKCLVLEKTYNSTTFMIWIIRNDIFFMHKSG